jgi:hypothetical protein
MTPRTLSSDQDLRLAQASTQFAGRITAALGVRSSELPHDISERLRAAREQAGAHARAAWVPKLATAAVVAGRSGGTATLGAPSPWWLKLASGLPVLMLLAGLIAIDRWTTLEDVAAAAEVDTLLLSDELPPQAYADPGFAEYLKSPQP